MIGAVIAENCAALQWNDINLFPFVGPELQLLRRHMDLRDAFCDAFSWGGWGDGGVVDLTKQEEQKHVTICHVPPGALAEQQAHPGVRFWGQE